MRRGGERGAVLPAAVLVLLLCTLLAHAAFVTAMSHEHVSRTGKDLMQARLAAIAGLERVTELDSLWGSSADAVWRGPWGVRASYEVRARALDRETMLLEGSGHSGETGEAGVTLDLGRLIWILDPAVRVAGRRAVVESGLPVDPSLIRLETWASNPAGVDPEACDSARDALAEIGRRHPARAVTSRDEPGLGLLGWDSLLARAARTLSGAVTPGPSEAAGRCLIESPDNLGDPGDPSGSCSDFFPLSAGAGDLSMNGGVGQGVLLVDGDLTLTGGARFLGVALVRGSLLIENGAVFAGVASITGSMRTRSGGSFLASSCAAYRALEGSADLRKPVRITGSGLIPLS